MDFLFLCLKSLIRKRLRTALTVFSIAIGVTSVIIISAVGDFGKKSVNDEINSFGLGGIAVSCNSTFFENGSISAEKAEIISQNSNVEVAMPIYLYTSKAELRGLEKESLVFGIDERAPEIVSMQILHGRNISQNDISSNANVCVIDADFAKSAYYRTNVVGKKLSVSIGGSLNEFEIIGVIKAGTGLVEAFAGDYIPSFVFIPHTTISSISGRNDFDSIVVSIKEGIDAENVGKQIVNQLKLTGESGDTYIAENLSSQRKTLEKLMNIVTSVLSAIGFISLIVAGIGIMTIMMISVNERTREIGIKKSIGAKGCLIMFEFLLQSLFITLLGCITGILFSYLLVILAELMLSLQIVIGIRTVLISCGFSILIGLIFGVYPAYKASIMNPVEALRTN